MLRIRPPAPNRHSHTASRIPGANAGQTPDPFTDPEHRPETATGTGRSDGNGGSSDGNGNNDGNNDGEPSTAVVRTPPLRRGAATTRRLVGL
ncbi:MULTISPECIES: hypothetical protein [Actinoplanes]|uniref:hypothetical protein n=1 Tax=Actinoplanes TaxID=1865 RepID=UPI0005F2C2E6|nr:MULTISPECIES: hypothetical protein [Actinoplanes]GLX99901.1 hypothetical protein Acsp01_02810 [Actinoplanes sp. NBRC 101535]